MSIKKYLQIFFQKEYSDIQTNQPNQPLECLSAVGISEINILVDLKNAMHVDNKDACNGIATWIETYPEKTSGWFFILPNCTFDG